MTNLLARVALGAAVLLVLVGCGGSPSTPLSSNAAPTVVSGSPASTSAAGQSPVGAGTAAPGNLPSLPAIFSTHADPALESQLPAEVSGTAMHRYSQTLSDVLDAGGDRAAIDAFLQSIGKTEADGSYAAAFDPSNALGGGVFAFKVSGADGAALLAGITALEQSDLGAGATTRQATVGGKNVTVVSVGSGANDTEWIHGRGDVVFVVHAADESHAAAFLQAIQ